MRPSFSGYIQPKDPVLILCIFDLMELGVNLGWSPASVLIWTMEGTEWNPGTDPSPSVVAAASHVADEIWKEIQHA